MSSMTAGKFWRRTDVKLTLWYILTFLLSAIIICGFLYVRLRHQLVREVDRFILDEIKELEKILANNPDDQNGLKIFEDHLSARTLYPIYFRVLTEKGSSFYTSTKFKEIGYVPDQRVWLQIRNGKETRENVRLQGRKRSYRIITAFLPIQGHPGFIIQVGTHLKFVRKSLSNFKSNLLIALPILVFLGSLGGWFLARRSLSPVGYIASRAQQVTSERLSERLLTRGTGDEMDGLILTINHMIARLEDSFKRMAEFTADVSHELKTPLCALRGEAEVLLSKARTAEEYQEGLAHFIERFDQLNRMINDLTLLSKADSYQIELNMGHVRLDLLISDIGELFQILAEQKKIVLNIDPLQETVVMGDKARLQQLFTNLIDNAIKYTAEGSIRVTIEKNEEMVIIKIMDTGIGISKEEQEKIFRRFYRVDKSRSKEIGGAGLGLSIAEWIAHAHHGRIEVESQLNKGSTFTVYLPIEET